MCVCVCYQGESGPPGPVGPPVSSSQIKCSDLELMDLLKVFPVSCLGSLRSSRPERRDRAPGETGKSIPGCRRE